MAHKLADQLWFESEYLFYCSNKNNIQAHLPTLRAYASQCESVVEFGTAHGRSATAILAACPRIFVTYDIVEAARVAQLLSHSTGTEAQFVRRSTLDGELGFRPDMLFIDDLHEEHHVFKELVLHGDLPLKYLAFHDTVSYPGVRKAIEQWLHFKPGRAQEWRVIHDVPTCNGFLILERQPHGDPNSHPVDRPDPGAGA